MTNSKPTLSFIISITSSLWIPINACILTGSTISISTQQDKSPAGTNCPNGLDSDCGTGGTCLRGNTPKDLTECEDFFGDSESRGYMVSEGPVVSYIPNHNFSGWDSFTFSCDDGNITSDTYFDLTQMIPFNLTDTTQTQGDAPVTVRVVQQNDRPVPNDIQATVNKNSSVEIHLLSQ